jgi:hypothetical protein
LFPGSGTRRSSASVPRFFALLKGTFSPFRTTPTSALIRGVTGIVIFLVLAQAAGWCGLVPRNVLPLASTVLARAAGPAGNARFMPWVVPRVPDRRHGAALDYRFV